MSNPMLGVAAKLQRAEEHLAALNDQVSMLPTSEPESEFVHIEVDGDRYRISVGPALVPVDEAEVLRLACIAGDLVQNLRAALDYFACELIRAEGRRQPGSNNAFPIYVDEGDWNRHVREPDKPRRSPLYGLQIDGPAWTFIERAQPFHLPEPQTSPLAVVNRLARHDKHRALYIHRERPMSDALRDFIGWNPDAVLLEYEEIHAPLVPEQQTEIGWLKFDPAGPEPNVHVRGPVPLIPTIGDKDVELGPGAFRELINHVRGFLRTAAVLLPPSTG